MTRQFTPGWTGNRVLAPSVGLIISFLVSSLLLFIACARPPLAEPALSQQPPASVIDVQAQLPQTSLPSSQPDPARPTVKRHTGLYLSLSDMPDDSDLDTWMQSLVQAGITLVLLDVGTREGVGNKTGEPRAIGSLGNVYFRTGWAETGRDIIGELTPVAHRHGLSVCAVVSLRRMNWVDPTLGWVDRSYDAARLQLRLTPYLDLFHPAFQEYLVGLFTDLSQTGIDGVLFRNDAPLGPHEGFSPFALRGFERDFQVRGDPAKLSPSSPAISRDGQRDRFRAEYSPEFWQWAGWKAREAIKVMVRLRRAMQMHAPTLKFVLEVHPEAVTDPVTALVQYGEDLLEAKRNGFDFFFVQTISPENALSSSLIERTGQLIGELERLWMPVVPAGDVRHAGEWLTPALDRDRFDRRVGLIYMGN